MKNFKIILLAISLFSAFILASCDDAATESGNGGSGIPYANVVVSDQDGEIGYAVSMDQEIIMLYTSEGYLVELTWSGAIHEGIVYYSDADCAGTAYMDFNDALSLYGKSVVYSQYNETLYVPANVNANGTATVSGTASGATLDTGYQCQSTSWSQTTMASGPVELVETDREAVGLPATITPPLKVEFK